MIESQHVRKMEFPQLPHYLTIWRVTEPERDIVRIVVESSVRVNREVRMPTQYSTAFAQSSPSEVEGDILSFVIRTYGLKLEPVRYS